MDIITTNTIHSDYFDPGLNGGLKSGLRKLYSAATGAPRAISDLVTGDIKDFKLFDDQSIVESFKQQVQGNFALVTAILGGKGVSDVFGSSPNPSFSPSPYSPQRNDEILPVPTTASMDKNLMIAGGLLLGGFVLHNLLSTKPIAPPVTK